MHAAATSDELTSQADTTAADIVFGSGPQLHVPMHSVPQACSTPWANGELALITDQVRRREARGRRAHLLPQDFRGATPPILPTKLVADLEEKQSDFPHIYHHMCIESLNLYYRMHTYVYTDFNKVK